MAPGAFFLGVLSFITVIQISRAAPFVRGCYFTSWAQYRPGDCKYTPDNYEKNICTHLFYAFYVISQDFRFTNFDPTDETLIDQLKALKQQQPDLKILISVGGWKFSQEHLDILKGMSSSVANRKTFIDSAAQFLRDKDLDGLDLDWEYPTEEDKANYAALLKEARAAFDQGGKKLLLTAAVSGNETKVQAGYDVKSVAQSLDYVNVMSYDLHMGTEPQTGYNSPLKDRNNDTLCISHFAEVWVKYGAPKEKVNIGMATYGRGFLSSGTEVGSPANGVTPAQTCTGEPGYAAYYEICQKVQNGTLKSISDPTQVATRAVSAGTSGATGTARTTATGANEWYGYNDVESFNGIADWVKKEGYAGAFVWTIDLDDFGGKCGAKYPLLHAMESKLA